MGIELHSRSFYPALASFVRVVGVLAATSSPLQQALGVPIAARFRSVSRPGSRRGPLTARRDRRNASCEIELT